MLFNLPIIFLIEINFKRFIPVRDFGNITLMSRGTTITHSTRAVTHIFLIAFTIRGYFN